MKAIKFTEIGKASLVDVDTPVPASDQVLVEVKSAGICASDIMAFKGLHPYRVPPVITGHEAAGVVVRAGSEIRGIKTGDRVAIEPHAGCGECEFCRSGNYQVCPAKKLIGVGSWIGVFSQYVLATESMCHVMPDGMSFDLGAALEPYCVGLHAVGRAELPPGSTVAVLGCGTIGMMTLLAARQNDPARILVSEISPVKTALALELGAEACVNPAKTDAVEAIREKTAGRGVDCVFITAPTNKIMEDAMKMCRRRGKVVVIATIAGRSEITTGEIQMYERTVVGSAMYNREDYASAMAQWQAGTLGDLGRLITRRIGLEEGPALITAMAEGRRPDDIKNIIAFQ